MTNFTPPGQANSGPVQPNPVTKRAHRKEILRQITLPALLAIIFLAGAVYLLASTQIASVEHWGEVSTIIVLIVFMVGMLIPLALVSSLIIIIFRLLSILPIYARQTQIAIQRVQSQVRSGADISVQPMLQIQSFLAMVETLFGRKKS